MMYPITHTLTDNRMHAPDLLTPARLLPSVHLAAPDPATARAYWIAGAIQRKLAAARNGKRYDAARERERRQACLETYAATLRELNRETRRRNRARKQTTETDKLAPRRAVLHLRAHNPAMIYISPNGIATISDTLSDRHNAAIRAEADIIVKLRNATPPAVVEWATPPDPADASEPLGDALYTWSTRAAHSAIVYMLRACTPAADPRELAYTSTGKPRTPAQIAYSRRCLAARAEKQASKHAQAEHLRRLSWGLTAALKALDNGIAPDDALSDSADLIHVAAEALLPYAALSVFAPIGERENGKPLLPYNIAIAAVRDYVRAQTHNYDIAATRYDDPNQARAIADLAAPAPDAGDPDPLYNRLCNALCNDPAALRVLACMAQGTTHGIARELGMPPATVSDATRRIRAMTVKLKTADA